MKEKLSSKQKILVIIRHGDVDNPRRIVYGRSVPVLLSREGYTQLLSLGRTLEKMGIGPDAVYSSPLQRGIRSSEALLEVFADTPLKTETDLTDVDHRGIQDKTLEWLAAEGADLYNRPDLKGTIEDQEEMAQRFIRAIRKITDGNPGERSVFVVTHGDPSAYGMWRLRFPERSFPPRSKILQIQSLGKGEAWRIEFDGRRLVKEPELVRSASMN